MVTLLFSGVKLEKLYCFWMRQVCLQKKGESARLGRMRDKRFKRSSRFMNMKRVLRM